MTFVGNQAAEVPTPRAREVLAGTGELRAKAVRLDGFGWAVLAS